MPHDNEFETDCDCGLLIRIKPSYIEYWDNDKQIWKKIYPPFRFYPDDDPTIATLKGADGRVLTFEAGCSVRIDGITYTDFNDVTQAIQTQVVDFFFSIGGGSDCCYNGGTTAQRPATPQAFEKYYDTTIDLLIIWQGTNWVNVTGAIV